MTTTLEVHCVVYADICRQGGEVPIMSDRNTNVNTFFVLSSLIGAAMEAYALNNMAKYTELIEIGNDGYYKAKQDIPTAGLTILFRGVVRAKTQATTSHTSKFVVDLDNFLIDGTCKARDFPSPWRLRKFETGNLATSVLVAPIAHAIVDSSVYSLPAGLKLPVLMNPEAIPKGAELITIGTPVVANSSLKGMFKPKASGANASAQPMPAIAPPPAK